jgi:hypothetical protein
MNAKKKNSNKGTEEAASSEVLQSGFLHCSYHSLFFCVSIDQAFFFLFSFLQRNEMMMLHTLSGIAIKVLMDEGGCLLACLGCCGVRVVARMKSSLHLSAHRPSRCFGATAIASSSSRSSIEAPPAAGAPSTASSASSSPSSHLLVGLDHVIKRHIQCTRHDDSLLLTARFSS